MKRRAQLCAWLGIATSLLACGTDDAPMNGGSAGSAGTGVAGSSSPSAGASGSGAAGASSVGTAGTAGTAAAGSSSAGSGGQATAGSSTGGAGAGQGGSGGAAAGNGGSNAGGSGGSGGSGGGAGSGGSGGSGGGGSTLPKRVLLYHFSTLTIDTVPQQLSMLKTQLETWGYEVEDSVKPDDISTTNLARFGGVGMINTCFEPFGKGSMGATQTAALKAFVEGGGGLFGTHCASVTFQSASPPNAYNDVIGGRGGNGSFDGKANCTTVDATHPTTMGLAATFEFNGNLDNADYVAADTKVLVKCKWTGGAMKEHAVSWYRTPGKGRVFYTNFAKIAADLSDATLGQKHIIPGLGWVLGR